MTSAGVRFRSLACGALLAAGLAVIAAGDAHATQRIWALKGVTFDDGATASGTFSFDDATSTVSSWNVTVNAGSNALFYSFTYMPGNSVAVAVNLASVVPTIALIAGPGSEAPGTREIRFTPQAVLDGTPAAVALDLPAGSGNVECYNCTPFRNITGGSLEVSLLGPPAALIPVIEYYHAGLDHYFMTSIAAEVALLDNGTIPGWARTGQSFLGYAIGSGGGGPSASPVCRFIGLPSAGLNSHFFSGSAAECHAVHVNFAGAWQNESGNVFQIEMPDTATGACPAGTSPVYRLFNNRADANHRYTTSLVTRAQMIAADWIPEGYGPEGVVMCAE